MSHKKRNITIFQEFRIRENLQKLIRFLITLFVMIGIFSSSFHYIMLREGREFSWVTGVYWTLTTMSTLGFGDITFQSDLGRVFSIIVLFSGMIYLLVLFPYTFLTFFYTPLMEFQSKFRVQKNAPEGIRNHIIIVGLDAVAESFIEKLNQYGHRYVLIADTIQKTKDWKDMGFTVIHGYPDDPDAYVRAGISEANMVFANAENEKINTTISFTVRELNSSIEIVSNVRDSNFIEILFLAGCLNTIDITESLGRSFSKRSIAKNHYVSEIGRFDKMVVWEIPVIGSVLSGKSLKIVAERLKGVQLVGAWKRGKFIIPEPDDIISSETILVVTGYEDEAKVFEGLFHEEKFKDAFVLIIGCGRVGRATAKHLDQMNVNFRILDHNSERKDRAEKEGLILGDRFVLGDGSRVDDLEAVGLNKASTIIISTHDDITNIFLTVYCRKLRNDVLILSRANAERNISTLHRAGADLVISYSSVGSILLLNLLRKSDNLMLAEGLEIFRISIPFILQGKTVSENFIRQKTGCIVIAVFNEKGSPCSLPSIKEPIPEFGEMILIGSSESERKFMAVFENREIF
ncbi:NAD-binding protein [Leptospira sp. 'Mane']|uniref:NAD-binding protein n=1 Tax=Leptospira sp. 'Mane' TaxID=3387407 RepID=UPI00398A7C76